MTKRTLASLGPLVRERRGRRNLRETAAEIGIGPATLMRVENGRVPDVGTFGKICVWLGEDPGAFLGFTTGREQATLVEAPIEFSAHLRADRIAQPATVDALARMIRLAIAQQREGTPEVFLDDEP
ncbi:MAG TPA: transcriptional regulator [Thermoanaerobaculia bacterium]|nr:transcriptional regulator [Thermoanaerobaculia bacterium]